MTRLSQQTNCKVMHFEKLHSHQLVGKAQENVLKDLKNKELNFEPFTENDTKADIKLLESKKAPGLDRKRSEMLKCGIHVLAPSLTILFNLSTENWKLSRCLVQYSNQVTSLSLRITEVRICVTSCLGKLFCSLLNKRLSNFVEANNLTHSSQIGLIKGLIEQLITFSR